MNNLQLQEQRFESIKSICNNFKKDSMSRKTIQYLNLRLSSLEDQWNDFNNRHAVLEQEVDDKTITYFTDDIYGKTCKMYESTRTEMKRLLQKLQEDYKSVQFDLSGLNEGENNEKLENLLIKQECNFKAIDRVITRTHIERLSEKWELEDQLSTLKVKWEAIDKLHWELEAHLKGTNDTYSKMFGEIETRYETLKKQLCNKIWTSIHYEKTVPKVEIPEFMGNYTQWTSFKDLFLESVHLNPLINQAQKMQLLKTKLRGEAERLVKHLPINADNYQSCWDILVQRYDNRRLQLTSLLNLMIELPVIQDADAFNLKKMHDVIHEVLNGLNNLGIDTEAAGSIIAHLMSLKLDSTTFDEYTKEIRDPREVPTVSELLYFLENRFMAYEIRKGTKKGAFSEKKSTASHLSKPTFTKPFLTKKPNFDLKTSFQKSYHTVHNNFRNCPYCEGSHVLMQCSKFLLMNALQRNNTVAKLKVCKNCLFSHGNVKCTSNKTCKECNLNHHTLLHNFNKVLAPNNENDNGQPSTSNNQTRSSNHLANNEMEILLTTIQLNVQAVDGTYVTLRALLDQGSQVNLITENAAQLLKLPRKKVNATISGIGSVSGDCKGRLQLNCKSIHSNYTFETKALILRKLTNNLPNSTFNKQDWPHLENHGVLREHSTTTKLRVVFNASQKTSSGYSLNSLQEKGPNLQKDIQNLILKWRSYEYAFTADIEKMYRCIWVAEEQQPLQKIIWRNSPTESLQEFQLRTVTYGTKSAPWLALRTLKQLAKDDGHLYPAAAEVLLNEFFVDDLVSGHNSLEDAQKLQQSLINLLGGAGMNLRKWSSNHPCLLANLNENQISHQNMYDFKNEETLKTLGLGWNPNVDTFIFNWNLENKCKQLTKRYLLSEISKLYDPLGWLSPITVTAKLIFQKVWKSKLDWNDNLPADIQAEWTKLRAELPEVKKISLNRWIGSKKDIELLGFCDASEKAYTCVVYSRVTNEQGQPIITLLAAKTRVAPLSQKTTLPRLELNGAQLLSQLIEKAKNALSNYNVTVKAWCDSQVVLAWLQGDSSRWERYVANRVERIKKVIPADRWYYVRSEHNPADCASRGLYPAKLMNFDLWWNGPSFLKTSEEKILQCTTTMCQVNFAQTSKTSSKMDEHFINELLNKYSSLQRVTRIVAWVTSFISTLRNKVKRDTDYLLAHELAAANEQMIKYVQRTDFESEYKQLLKNELVSTKSKIYKLSPYLDEKGIMRVGGRLSNSHLPPQMKHPAILPNKGRLTQLIIQQAHMETLHGGARLTLTQIRQRYWILSGNRVVKSHLRSCVKSHRFRPTVTQQRMGNLPPQRTTPSRPFTHMGVDFTGHIDVKLNKGRGVKTSKGWVISCTGIFACPGAKSICRI